MNFLYVSQIIAVIALISLFYRLTKSLTVRFRLHDLLIGISILSYSLAITTRILYSDFDQLLHTDLIVLIYEWLRILSVSMLLSGLGLMVRDAKPKINRAPIALSLIPLLLLVIHPFVMHTIVLKEVLIQIYIGGALFIALLLFTLKSYNKKRILPALYGTLLLTTAFIYGQVSENIIGNSESVQLLLISISTVFLAVHYNNQHKSDENQIETEKQHATV